MMRERGRGKEREGGGKERRDEGGERQRRRRRGGGRGAGGRVKNKIIHTGEKNKSYPPRRLYQ